MPPRLQRIVALLRQEADQQLSDAASPSPSSSGFLRTTLSGLQVAILHRDLSV